MPSESLAEPIHDHQPSLIFTNLNLYSTYTKKIYVYLHKKTEENTINIIGLHKQHQKLNIIQACLCLFRLNTMYS